MTTETQPHVVYPKEIGERAPAIVCRSYGEAHLHWKRQHTHADPWLIATLGRVIDPATPIIDCNE
jgi:hypothetical protein